MPRNWSTVVVIALTFILGWMLRPILEVLAAPLLGPRALGLTLSTTIAVGIAIGLPHYLSRNTMETLYRFWTEPVPSFSLLFALGTTGIGLRYAYAVATWPDVDSAVNAVGTYCALLSAICATSLCLMALRSVKRYCRALWNQAST